MVASWPVELPVFVMVSGYDESVGNNLLMSKTDSGPGKTRRRMTSAVDPMRASIEIDSWQVQRLDQFYRVELKEGSLPFERPHPRLFGANLTIDAESTFLLNDNGDELLIDAIILVKFSEPPHYTPVSGTWWNASLAMDVMP